MRLITPPEGQGQMVEVSYGWDEGVLYRRTHDHSNNEITWARLSWEASTAIQPEWWDAVHGAPNVADDAWQPCEEPTS